MNAVLVSVDYADILAVTLPYNRFHFERVLVVTAPWDEVTPKVADVCGAQVYVTDAFRRAGAVFNKWLALEEALDACDYRHGWLCNMDADVLWPKAIKWTEHRNLLACKYMAASFGMHSGQLATPLRRMRPELTVCPESEWKNYQVHRNVQEWAGYSQIFHCDNPVLGPPPWHELNWRHAGGADSFFQRKWKPENKVRPPFECLHLGESGVNWMGRADKNPELRERMMRMWSRRRQVGFDEEKL